MSFYKDHYQVVIMGGGLAGMACALRLQKWGIKDILILEKHNLPGSLPAEPPLRGSPDSGPAFFFSHFKEIA